jgi:hypothetical protein
MNTAFKIGRALLEYTRICAHIAVCVFCACISDMTLVSTDISPVALVILAPLFIGLSRIDARCLEEAVISEVLRHRSHGAAERAQTSVGRGGGDRTA